MKVRRLGTVPALLLVTVAALLLRDARAGFILPATTLRGPPVEASAYFGYAIASADFNGDGYDDLLVSAPYADAGGSVNSGEVFVFTGPSLSPGPVLRHPLLTPEGRFGDAVAAGDVNGDTIADAVVGAPYAPSGSQDGAGQVFIFYGPSLEEFSTIENPSPSTGAHFGMAVGTADVNDDGVDDVVAGAPDAQYAGLTRAGRAFVLTGPSFSTVYELHDPEPEASARFGRGVAGGDRDGDGDEDVIVGAPDSDMGAQKQILDAGQAFVFTAPSLLGVMTLQDPEPQGGAYFGRAVAAGDFDDDGDNDVMVGAHGSDISPHPTAGQVFVFSAPALTAITVIEEPVAELDAYFGFALAAADVNGDGYDDAVIGAHDADVGNFVYTSGGEAYIYYGPSFSQWVRFEDPVMEKFAFFARAVAVGDVNNDGWGDFIAGGPWSDVSGMAEAGEAFVFFADRDGDGDGIPDRVDNCPLVLNPGQENVDSTSMDNGPSIPGDDITVAAGDNLGDVCDDDNDNDGLPDALESEAACPWRLVRDSDGDGAIDGYEVERGNDPCSAASRPPTGPTGDTDGDGLSDGLEVRGYGTRPDAVDSDADGCDDDKEAVSVNDDKQANLADVLWAGRAAFGLIPCHAAVDLNRSATCELVDALMAARNSTLLEPHSPCP